MIEISERPLRAAFDRGATARAASDVDLVVVAAFEAHAERLTSFAMAATRDRDVAEDMVAETYLRFIRELQGGRVPDKSGAGSIASAATSS